jgi:hypothetical protein
MTSSPLGSTGRTYAKQRRMWRRWPVPTRLLVQSTVKRSRMTSSNSGTPSSLNQRSVRSRRTASRPFMLSTARQVRHRVQKFRVRPIVSRVSRLHMCLIMTYPRSPSLSPPLPQRSLRHHHPQAPPSQTHSKQLHESWSRLPPPPFRAYLLPCRRRMRK